MADPDVVIYVRSPALQRVAQLDDFQQLEAIPRFNAVGSWTLDIDRRTVNAVALTTPGYGIEVTYGGATILSGPIRYRQHHRTLDAARATISGVTDEVWLARRLASPQPATTAPPYSTQAYDTRTGTCSTMLRQFVDVNAGPSAIGPRKVTGLTLAADPVIGPSVTGRGRWQPLLALLVELATAGGVGFRLAQSGATLPFAVYQPVDRTTTVRFGLERGNLASHSYESTAPDATYVVVGGGGEGTARTILEVSDAAQLATWTRIEQFVDRRDTTDPTELGQAGAENLAGNTEQVGLSIEPIDTDQCRFGTHYNLGDRVTVLIDGGTISDVVREVKLTLTPDGPRKVAPTIGTPGLPAITKLFRDFRDMASRLTNLERR